MKNSGYVCVKTIIGWNMTIIHKLRNVWLVSLILVNNITFLLLFHKTQWNLFGIFFNSGKWLTICLFSDAFLLHNDFFIIKNFRNKNVDDSLIMIICFYTSTHELGSFLSIYIKACKHIGNHSRKTKIIYKGSFI